MKAEVLKILKERGKTELFTQERFAVIKELMKLAMKKDEWLRNYLPLDPLNKAQWAADYLIKLTEMGKI